MTDTDDETDFKFPMASDVGGKPKGVSDVLDQLDCEIRFARGLTVAIEGLQESALDDEDHAGVRELADAHARRLRLIRDGLAELNAQMRVKKDKKAKRKKG